MARGPPRADWKSVCVRATRAVRASWSRRLRARAERATLAMLLAAMVLFWGARTGTRPAWADGDATPNVAPAGEKTDLDLLLGAAAGARQRGTLREAESLLRRAIGVGGRDGRPAAMLRALYAEEDLALPVDEEAVRAALATLGPGYRVTDTRHFVTVSDCDPAWRARREALLERTYHEVMRFAERIGLPAYPPSAKLLCVMMHDHDAYQAFGRATDDVQAHWVAGYYAGANNRIVLYDDETGPTVIEAGAKLDALAGQASLARTQAREASGTKAAMLRDHADTLEKFIRDERARLERDMEVRSEAKTIHEAAHLIAFNCGLQARSRRYPMWITEGLATGFETDTPERSFGPDRAYADREAQFDRVRDDGRLERLRTFVGRVRTSDDAEKAEAEYAEVYGIFRHIARFHREDLAALLSDIAAEPPGEISPERHLEMFERRFGSVERLERKWLRLEDR